MFAVIAELAALENGKDFASPETFASADVRGRTLPAPHALLRAHVFVLPVTHTLWQDYFAVRSPAIRRRKKKSVRTKIHEIK